MSPTAEEMDALRAARSRLTDWERGVLTVFRVQGAHGVYLETGGARALQTRDEEDREYGIVNSDEDAERIIGLIRAKVHRLANETLSSSNGSAAERAAARDADAPPRPRARVAVEDVVAEVADDEAQAEADRVRAIASSPVECDRCGKAIAPRQEIKIRKGKPTHLTRADCDAAGPMPAPPAAQDTAPDTPEPPRAPEPAPDMGTKGDTPVDAEPSNSSPVVYPDPPLPADDHVRGWIAEQEDFVASELAEAFGWPGPHAYRVISHMLRAGVCEIVEGVKRRSVSAKGGPPGQVYRPATEPEPTIPLALGDPHVEQRPPEPDRESAAAFIGEHAARLAEVEQQLATLEDWRAGHVRLEAALREEVGELSAEVAELRQIVAPRERTREEVMDAARVALEALVRIRDHSSDALAGEEAARGVQAMREALGWNTTKEEQHGNT